MASDKPPRLRKDGGVWKAPGPRDSIIQKPRRETYSLQVKVPMDLRPDVLGKPRKDGTRKPIKTIEVQLKARKHAPAVLEAAPIKATILQRFAALRAERENRRIRIAAGIIDEDEIKWTTDIVGDLADAPQFEPRLADHTEPYLSSRSDLKRKTVGMVRHSLALLIQYVGGENARVSKLFAPMVTAWADAMRLEGTAKATINAHLSKCAGFWDYLRLRAIAAGENPFTGQWLKAGKHEGKRNRFTADQLNLLLQPSELRWHILAALYSGLRLSELVKARVDGVAFHIAEEGDGKTEAADRILPIHSALIRLGFVEAWPSANTMPADTVSEKFTLWRQSLGIGAPKGERSDRTLHSLRHNFSRALRLAGTPKTMHDALMGHAGGALFTRYAGTEGPAFELLREAIEKIAYPGLKL